jgi:hypothetical protein
MRKLSAAVIVATLLHLPYSASPAAAEPEMAVIRGLLANEGWPLERSQACVAASVDGVTEVTRACEVDGYFHLSVPYDTAFAVRASAPGHVDTWSGPAFDFTDAVKYVVTRSMIDPLYLIMPIAAGSGATMRGRVVRDNGEPLAGVMVRLERRAGNWQQPLTGYAQTDGDGYYEQPNVPGGYATASLPGLGVPGTVVPDETAVVTVLKKDSVTLAPVSAGCVGGLCGQPAIGLAVRPGAHSLPLHDTDQEPHSGLGMPSGTMGTLLDSYFTGSVSFQVAAGERKQVEALVEPAGFLEFTAYDRRGRNPQSQPWACFHAFPVQVPIGFYDPRFVFKPANQYGSRGDCTNHNPGEYNRLGPYPLRTVQLFAGPPGNANAQWLGETGPVGSQRLAKRFTIRKGLQVMPPVGTDQYGNDEELRIMGGAWDPVLSQPVRFCMSVLPPNRYYDFSASHGIYYCNGPFGNGLSGLGPYEWNIMASGPGYARQWAPTVTRAGAATYVPGPPSSPGLFDVDMIPAGSIQVTGADPAPVEVFDAYTGDLLAADQLASLPVYVRYQRSGETCWYGSTVRMGGSISIRRLVQAQAGQVVTLNVTGLSCIKGAPPMLTGPA